MFFIIFFSVFLVIFGAVNYYIGLRGYQCLPDIHWLKTAYLVVFITLACSYLFSRFIEKISITSFSNTLFWIGSFWFGFLLYFFLFAVLFDFIRVIHHFTGFLPGFITQNYLLAKQIAMLIAITVTVILQITGFIHANTVQIKDFTFHFENKHASLKEINLVFVSDIHLGTIIKNAHLEKLTSTVNSLNPDIIVLGGDVFDEDLFPVIQNNLGDILKELKAKYGVYAVPGNHEYIGGIDKAIDYLTKHKITVLRDQSVMIQNSLVLMGADDASRKSLVKESVKSIREYIQPEMRSLPKILAMHNPSRLKEAVNPDHRIGLVLCGHTHHGQMWPANHITDLIYSVSYGYKQFGKTHVYVSSGFGTWGPPVKIGTHSEIIQVKIKLD